MPYFLITDRLIIDILKGFEGQGNPAVLVESPSARQIGEKLGRGTNPRRKRKIGGTQVEGRVWVIELDPRRLTLLTADTPGLSAYYQNLISAEEDVRKYRVCLIGETPFVFAPRVKRILYMAQVPFRGLSG